ncbi:hypothetical protein [Streptomyces sp. NPDC047315]|uniref:hypothetical protein n=1 Tax=Streptomyces sp. NPDC047315 TaxID=3155142 RepID=UPI003410DD48
MSSTQSTPLQDDVQGAARTPANVSREHLLDLVSSTYARGGAAGPLDHDVIDIMLAEVADKAACSFLRDRWEDSFPLAAYDELLSAVAALRAVLGFDPTPTACEVLAWSDELERQLAGEVDSSSYRFSARFTDGPYRGTILAVPGTFVLPDMGPAATLTLPIAWGDTADPGRGKARYRRGAMADQGVWPYRLDEVVRKDARPHITVPTSDQAGA